MAGSGDLINYTNYVALDGSSWRASTGIGGGAGTSIFYISAPAWYVTFRIWGSGLWGYQEGSLYVYPYDPTTGTFLSTAVYGSYASGRGSGDIASWNFKHNKDGGSSKDTHDSHLWKISVYEGDNHGGSYGTLYVGGLGCATEDIYNNYFKGRKIYCSKGAFWKKGSGTNQYASDEAFLQEQGYSCMRGTQISISTGTYKYVCAKGE